MNKITFSAVFIMSVFIYGCGDEASDGGNEGIVSPITYYAQDTIRQTQPKDEYIIDLSNNIDSSDGSTAYIQNVESLDNRAVCKISTIYDNGFKVSANQAVACYYRYTVGSRNRSSRSTVNEENTTALVNVLIGEKTEQLKPISVATTVNSTLTINIIDEQAKYGEEIPSGYTLSDTVLVVGSSSSSVIALTGDDSIRYQPDSDFSGVERILYSYTNGSDVLSGTIDVAVSSKVNTAPVAKYFFYIPKVPNEVAEPIDVFEYISDDDNDVLQLISVYSYDATLNIVNDANSNGNQFDDTVFTFMSDRSGRHSVTYVVSDNKGGFATGVIELYVANVYPDILLTTVEPNLLFTPPYTSDQAYESGVKYTPGPIGNGSESLSGLSTAKHSWKTANAICEARGGKLPSTYALTELYNAFPSGGIFDSYHWPVDVSFWALDASSSTSYQSINMKTGVVTDEPMETQNYVACLTGDIVRAEVVGKEYIDVSTGQPSVTESYELYGYTNDNTPELINNDDVSWSIFINPAYLASFNKTTGELTTYPQIPERSGEATIIGCTPNKVCASKVVELSSKICGVGINDTDRENAAKACIKLAEMNGRIFTSNPSIPFLKRIDFSNYYNEFTEGSGGYGPDKGTFARFRLHGVPKLCQKFNDIRLYERDNWKMVIQDEYKDLYYSNGLVSGGGATSDDPALGMYRKYGWPTRHSYWAAEGSLKTSGWCEKRTLKDGRTERNCPNYILSVGRYNDNGESHPNYASCVSYN